MIQETSSDQQTRRACTCEDCRKTRAALALLDYLAQTETWMPSVEIEVLCKAREVLAGIVGMVYDESGDNRYV